MHTTINRLIAGAFMLACHTALAANLYVAPSGSDDNPGTEAKPFATLERARDAVRALRQSGTDTVQGVTVWLKPGVYPRTQTFELTAADSGTKKSPVVYRSEVRGGANLDAGHYIEPADFRPISDRKVLARLDQSAHGKVFQFDLAPLGLKHLGPFPQVFNDGGGLVELFCNGQRMPLSRWPNEGFVTMAKVLDRGDWSKGPGRHGGKFVARDDRPARWNVDNGVWLEGYWRVPWEPQTIRVQRIDAATREITFAEPINGGIGSKYAKAGELGDGKEPWCAVNLLEEIDQPGEWCIDFATKTLYFWPPRDTRLTITLSDFEQPLVTLRDVSYVMLRGFTFWSGLGNGIEISGGAHDLIAGCTLRNLGGSGVLVKGGRDHVVRSCTLHDLGQGGIHLSGGDRKTLTPARHIAENNELFHLGVRRKTYAAAIHVGAYGGGDAVGCRVAHNFMHDLPHAAVLYGGNDHVFEFNEVARVALTSGDVGAFYTWNDWTSRGNVVRYNFVYESPRANAFYMDDGDSGDTIFGNVVYRCSYGPFIGGGHDNVVRNNLVIDTQRGLHLDARGIARGYATNQNLIRRLEAANSQQPPWSTRYPTLALLLDGPRDVPTGNVVENNVVVACKEPLHFAGKKEELARSTMRDNLVLTENEARFVEPAKLDFRLRSDSAVFKRLPAFKPIPFEQIGLVKDEYRTALPAAVRSRAPSKPAGSAFDSNTDVQRSNQR